MDTALATKRIEKLIWVLVYGGLLSFVISWFLPDGDANLARWMVVGGLGVAALGFAGIYIRSKMQEPK